jgi:competence protein ComEC
MNRPLAAVVFAYVAGLLLAQIFQPPLAALFAASFLILVLVLVRAKLRGVLLWPLLALVGWTNFAARTAVVSPHDLRTLLGNDSAIVTVRGTLLETPSLRIYLRDEEVVERSVASVRVTAWHRDADWSPATGDIIVTTPGVLGGNYFAGQPVEIYGVLARPEKPVAEGMFDYQSHLEKLGVYYALKTSSTNDWSLGAKALSRAPFSARFILWARHALARGLDPADKSTQLLLAMTLGQKTALTDEVSEPFMRSGTMHIFAISGLHIALIAGILLAVLRVAQVPRSGCGVIVLPLIWFYTAATGWQPSAIRSTIMMSVIIAGWSLKRPSDLLNSLAAAGFIILLWDPLQLFQASFQLSFFVVLSIALFSPPLEKLRDRLLQTDPLLPRELLPRWRRWLAGPLRFLATTLTTSLAAWLGSLPLTAYYFHLFSPVTLLANVVIVPLAGFALMANLGGLFCGTWLTWFTELFNNAAWFFMHLMVRVSETFTQLPAAWAYVPAPPLTLIALYFALLIGISSGWLLAETRRKFLMALLLFLALVGAAGWQWSRDRTELTVLPLNGGHAVYVDADGRRNDWLINCGNENAVDFTLKNFLRAQGVNSLPRLVLADGNIRNCGGARTLDELFNVGELWTSGVRFRSAAYREAVAEFAAPGRAPVPRHRILNCGDTAGCWQVLFPAAPDNLSKADDDPLVLRGSFHGTKILLLDDLSRAGQSDLLSGTNDLRADIAVAGLPGEGEPLCDALMAAIHPRVVVIADSEFPATRRASRALHERLARSKIPVIYTRTAGAVTIFTDQSGWRLQTMDGQSLEFR